MKSLIQFTTVIGLLSVTSVAMADSDHSSVMELPSQFLMSAYAALEDGLSSSEYMQAISRTDVQALRELVSPEDWDDIYKFATFRGQLTFRNDTARNSAGNPDYIGSDPNKIEMLTLFSESNHSLQRWGMIDERSATTVFETALSKPGRSLIDDDLMEISSQTSTEAPDVFVRRDTDDIILSLHQSDEDDVLAFMTGDPDYVHFSNAYTAMIAAAEKMVPEHATIVELSVRSWGNRTPDLVDTAFPKNITAPVDADGVPLTPLFGFAVVDWRMPGPQYGVTLAINHFDACEEVVDYSAGLTDIWNAASLPDDQLAGSDMLLKEPFQLVADSIDGVLYCSTVVSVGPAEDRDGAHDGAYARENPLYRTVNRLLLNEFTTWPGRENIFSLKW